MQQIISINDGDIAIPKIVKEYEIEDLCRDGRYNFVGFINKRDKILISCPKHFLYRDENDIKLIIRCILKSFRTSNKGSSEKIDCNIPFRAYLDVLGYYYKYGLFKKRSVQYRQGYSGNIDWNRTIRKSQKIISNGNLLFLPFEVKETVKEDTFIGKCMQYVINEGYEQFGRFAAIGERLDSEDVMLNFKDTEAVIKQLKDEEGKHFRDSEIQLIRSLISYFRWEGSVTENAYFLTQSFELSWEAMVHNYLNENLYDYNRASQSMIFKNGCRKYKFKKDVSQIESQKKRSLNHGFKIEFDHLSETQEDGTVMLFDSKYYEKIREANYKQIAYHYFLIHGSNGVTIPVEKIINGLILPTEGPYLSKTHIDRSDIDGVYIQEHYLNLREVMERYSFR